MNGHKEDMGNLIKTGHNKRKSIKRKLGVINVKSSSDG